MLMNEIAKALYFNILTVILIPTTVLSLSLRTEEKLEATRFHHDRDSWSG
jgi:hypothetical protein